MKKSPREKIGSTDKKRGSVRNGVLGGEDVQRKIVSAKKRFRWEGLKRREGKRVCTEKWFSRERRLVGERGSMKKTPLRGEQKGFSENEKKFSEN